MENKRNHMLHTTMSKNIGQITLEEAPSHIDRLHKQDGRNWRMDTSEFMFVWDETDEDVHNPCKLNEGYVWVTCEPEKKLTRELILEWWNNLPNNYTGNSKGGLAIKHNFGHKKSHSDLTYEEIKEIWLKETKVVGYCDEGYPLNSSGDIVYKSHAGISKIGTGPGIKPNQKQFKQFDSELARQYLNKFDSTAKKHFILEACDMLSKNDLLYIRACISEIISEK